MPVYASAVDQGGLAAPPSGGRGRIIFQPQRLVARSAAIHAAPVAHWPLSRGSPRPAPSISHASHHGSAVSGVIPVPVRMSGSPRGEPGRCVRGQRGEQRSRLSLVVRVVIREVSSWHRRLAHPVFELPVECEFLVDGREALRAPGGMSEASTRRVLDAPDQFDDARVGRLPFEHASDDKRGLVPDSRSRVMPPARPGRPGMIWSNGSVSLGS